MTATRLIATIAAMMMAVGASAGIDIGPAIGTTAPPLKARDTAGQPVSFSEISGKSGVVIAFVRSADWCPYCQTQLIDLQAAQAPLAKRGYTLAALSYDTPMTLAEFARKREIGYMLLSDEKSEMIDAYGIRDPQYPATSKAYGVPKPGIFVIDAKGVVRAKLAEDGYKMRPPVEAIIDAIEALGPAAKQKN